MKAQQCAGKMRYPHERAARESAAYREECEKAEGRTVRLRVYRCLNAHCGGWHLSEVRDRRTEGY